jgi:hypothetical protein
MTSSNVPFRAGPLLEEFIAVLAEHGHTTVKELHEMFSSCILCLDYATSNREPRPSSPEAPAAEFPPHIANQLPVTIA